MKKILLMGNPNVGKSAVFSRLTGARVVISNYPGTTVEFTQGYTIVKGKKITIIDVPGTYSLDAANKAENVGIKMLDKETVVINVIDATNLERNLYLTMQLLEMNIPIIVILNMWDDTSHKGIKIDIGKLEKVLGVAVVPTCGLTGYGIKELIERLPNAKCPGWETKTFDQKWQEIGEIIKDVQQLSHRHHTFLESLQDLSIKSWTGLILAAAVIYVCFNIIRFIGEGLINYIFGPFFNNIYSPLIMKLTSVLGTSGFLHNIIIGKLIGGKIDFVQSFGLLTTGLYVPIAMVLPYILSFYLILGLLEDIGYLPRLAVLADNVMHRIGLHGYAIVPMILGLGCNVPGALATRLMPERREKFIAATLMSIAVPCMAQSAMIFGLLGQKGGRYVGIVYLTLFLIWIILGRILHRALKGQSPELILEIPPYRMPQMQAVLKKLWMRVYNFLTEAVPYVLLGVFIVNILYDLKIVDFLSALFSPILKVLWGLPSSTISAMLVGFLRKDVAVGMLGSLGLTAKQLTIGSTILTIYFPCIATFVVLVKELGIKDMFKATVIMLLIALITGSILNLIL